MHTIIKEIDNQFFQLMEGFILENVNKFRLHNIMREEIKIYIPNYLMRMYERWLYESRYTFPDYNIGIINRIRGVEILDNYENTVVVSFKDIHLKGLKPSILPVP